MDTVLDKNDVRERVGPPEIIESVRQHGDPVTGEPPPAWVRGICPECGQPLVSGCFYVGGRGYMVIWECWASLQVPATCTYRKVL